MSSATLRLDGAVAGVPFLALPPPTPIDHAPLVVVWHLAGSPRSERAMAAALPLQGLPAWRLYLGLPMLGSRLPEGGLDEFFRRFREDPVLNVFDPITRAGVEEFPDALAEVRRRLPLGNGPLGLVGGSLGAWVALGVLTETELPVSTVALVSPAIRAASVVAHYERLWGTEYGWTAKARGAAERLDFVARADEITERDTATLLVVGATDDQQGFRQPADELRRTLAQRAPSRTALVRIPAMEHALADEPGLEPAPQTAHAAQVDAALVDWFRQSASRQRALSKQARP